MSSTDLPRLAAIPAGGRVLQRVQRGANHVVRVRRTVALGHDVGDAHHFENSAHRAAGDDAGTLGSRRIITTAP
jgi:hypothetical protein